MGSIKKAGHRLKYNFNRPRTTCCDVRYFQLFLTKTV